MPTNAYDQKPVESLEENLKKALTELLILSLLSHREHYIGEMSKLIESLSGGRITIVFPYSAVYRLEKDNYIAETNKRIAPDGRRRQYIQITEQGREYLKDLLWTYQHFLQGIDKILTHEEGGDGDA